jgi:Ran GTPase-activating protein (RanGAP) involved in mRNA processing and transport
MPGDPPLPPVQCPVHRVDITPCDAAELAPLLACLDANEPLQGHRRFPRGSLLDDGRLDLCKQSLGADHCLRITQALQHNTRVRSLMLGTDAIGDAGADAVGRLAAANPHLEVLYLGCNNIGPDGARRLGAALAGAGQLTGLWLKRNPLGPDGAGSIAQLLRGHRRLRVLDLVNTDLRDAGVQALADALCTDNRSLQCLYLGGNGLGPSSATALARLLRDAPHLQALYLSVNHLGDEGAATLAQGLAANRTLQVLELASSGIGPEGARALFAAARQHPGLHTLNLGYAVSTRALAAQANHIRDAGAGHAADLLAAGIALRELDLTHNGITDRGRALLADALCNNGQLTRLAIEGRVPAPLALQLERNRARHGDRPAPGDQAMVRSVYR